VLSDHTRQLQRLRSTGASLSDEIRARQALQARLAAETATVTAQRDSAQGAHATLQEALSRARAAPVLDYVRAAAAAAALKEDAAAMERRVAVASGALKHARMARAASGGTSRSAGVAFGSTVPRMARHQSGAP
jgi:hypothetical protein